MKELKKFLNNYISNGNTENCTIFEMNHSNIIFFPLGDGNIVSNKTIIEFIKDYDINEIPVNEETKEK